MEGGEGYENFIWMFVITAVDRKEGVELGVR